jgi:hypothetical protein
MTRFAIVAALAFIVALPARQALACGGCFSPPAATVQQTVVQDAERVLFYTHPQDPKRQIAWVEVRYTGLAKDFGWVLPLPKVPTVTVGPAIVFDRLDDQLRARFQLQYQTPENCRSTTDGCDYQAMHKSSVQAQDAASGAFAPAPGVKADENNGGATVQVLKEGTTGPYDYKVVQGKVAQPLLDWLNEKGYATPQKALPILDSHIQKGDVFVAVKLSNGAGVNQIKPIVLEMTDSDPCVPLRLTSIAAQDDMTVAVTIAGPGRAIPKNHLHVEVNPLRVDWNSGGANWLQLVAAAIDEAGGRAFVTESAQPGSGLAQLGKQFQNAEKMLPPVKTLYEFALALPKTGLPMHEDVAQALDPALGLGTMWAGVSAVQALANLRSCGQYFSMPFGPATCNLPNLVVSKEFLQGRAVDGQKAFGALDQGFLHPLREVADGLGAAPVVSRLTMRISPDEMDRDPIFAFNKELPMVAPLRTAVFKQVCSTGWYPVDGQRYVFAGLGSWLLKPGQKLNQDPRFKDAPLALKVELLDEQGLGKGIAPKQIELVDTAIMGAQPGKPSLPEGLTLQERPAWQPPKDDPPQADLHAWKKPYPSCIPKPGWVDGALPPKGAVKQDPRVKGYEGTGKAIGPSAESARGIDDAAACTASPTSHGSSLLLLLGLCALAVVAARRSIAATI